MATTQHQGTTAQLTYTPPGGVLTTHLLALPLRDLRPVDARVRHEWWSGDLTTREVVVIGDGVRELVATIRFDDEPGSLKDLLRAGLEDDVTITYEKVAGGTSFPFKLLEVVGSDGVELQPDADRWGLGEWQCRIRIRRVDGGSFDSLLT